MKYISKAPFRIGLGGGGTDVSPYSDLYGGRILNATIEIPASEVLNGIEGLMLQVGVCNHIFKNYSKTPLNGFELITTIDVPTGSGLGTSSTLVVAIIGAFMEWLKLPLGEYDVANVAVNIERKELQMAGGKQDQYAATFGGFNFMEFYKDRVIVNPLRLKSGIIRDFNYHLLLFYTKTERESSNIIETQKQNFKNAVSHVIESTHMLKEQALKMKEALLIGNLSAISVLLNEGWEHKKKLAAGITNQRIEEVYSTAINAGATGGKISGAGGGGFMIFYCPNNTRFNVIDALKKIDVIHQRYSFQNNGLETWTSQL